MFEIKEIPIESIIIKDRQRKDLGDIEKIKALIKSVGQLNPILVTPDYKLISGERRIVSLKKLKRTHALVRIMPNLSKRQRVLIEYAENAGRKDFTWQEDLNMKVKLHNIWANEAKKKNKRWGFRKTASELGCAASGLFADLNLAEGISLYPELGECANKTQAKNMYRGILRHVETLNAIEDLDAEEKERLDTLMSSEPIEEIVNEGRDMPSIPQAKHADVEVVVFEEAVDESEDDKDDAPEAVYSIKTCEDIIEEFPNGTVSLVELDPPGENEPGWSQKELFEFYSSYLPKIFKILINDSWVICWTDIRNYIELNDIAQRVGFSVQEKPGICMYSGLKGNVSERTMINNYDSFVLIGKGNSFFNNNVFPAGILSDSIPESRMVHPDEKPLGFYKKAMPPLAREDGIFLSPFAGSGNSMIIAAGLGMKPIGCDKIQKYAMDFYARYKKYFKKEVF